MPRDITKLPRWAQELIAGLQARVDDVEKTLPWTEPGMEWFTLFWPGPRPESKTRAPQRLFTCSKEGTLLICTLGPKDWVFVGRGKGGDNQCQD